MPTCLFRLATGLPCPSCGMTRAFCALGHGDVAAAVHWNLASPLVCAAVAVAALLGAGQALTGRDMLGATWRATRRQALPATLVAMAAAWTVNLLGGLAR